MKTCTTTTTVLMMALASANGQVDRIPSCAAACGGPNLPNESVCQYLNFLRETSTFSTSCARNCEDYDYFAIFDLYDELECQSELSPGRAGCSNICDYAYDDDCDDGGAGSEYNLCDWGTDCNDCGRREPEPTLQASAGTNQTKSGFLKSRKAKKMMDADAKALTLGQQHYMPPTELCVRNGGAYTMVVEFWYFDTIGFGTWRNGMTSGNTASGRDQCWTDQWSETGNFRKYEIRARNIGALNREIRSEIIETATTNGEMQS